MVSEVDQKTTPVFTVWGPFPIPLKSSSLAVDKAAFRNSLSENDINEDVGCYVICGAHTKGYRPLYVGKTARGLTTRLLEHVGMMNKMLDDGEARALAYFVVWYAPTVGRINLRAIDALETELIRRGKRRNKDLWNLKKVVIPKVRIKGVMNARGTPSKAAQKFAAALGIGT